MQMGCAKGSRVRLVRPCEDFDVTKYLGSRVANAKLDPTAADFFSMPKSDILHVYSRRNPGVDLIVLQECLDYVPRHLFWAGSDLFPVLDADGAKKMLLLEMNSRPAGATMPPVSPSDPERNYRVIIELLLHLASSSPHQIEGDVAILYDTSIKGEPHAKLAAKLLQDECNVWYVQWLLDEPDPDARWTPDGILQVRDENGVWHPIRACFRFLGERAWTRLPLRTKTVVVNDVLVCLAGGRNKSLAALAYAEFNEELRRRKAGLQIVYPRTIPNVPKAGLVKAAATFNSNSVNGVAGAVIKVPYGHSGNGVYMVQGPEDLEQFRLDEHQYDIFVVQRLITPKFSSCNGQHENGHETGVKTRKQSEFTLLGTRPDAEGQVFTFDLRFIVVGTKDGIRPHLAYGRRAKAAWPSREKATLASNDPPPPLWDFLGTNISFLADAQGNYGTDNTRALVLDSAGMELMDLNLDDLLESYVQTLLAAIAIDKMCIRLMPPESGRFNAQLFAELNKDDKLMSELLA